VTTRPGIVGLDSLAYTRAKGLCHLLLIIRPDGQRLAVTDHDRQVTFEGDTYRPIVLGELSADRREAALRTGSQEAKGVIDSISITASDIDAQNYVGSEVRQVIVDWVRPWIVLARHRRWIRQMLRTGASFTATLEGRAQQLQRPQGGRFGGVFTPKCPYRLGGKYCKKDIGQWTQLNPTDTGNATSSTIDSVTDSTQSWAVNSYQSTTSQHYYVLLRPNSGTGTINQGSGQLRKILSNTATTVALDEPFETTPAQTIGYRLGQGFAVSTIVSGRARYEFKVATMAAEVDQWFRDGAVIFASGANIGRTFAIADYRSSDRKLTLLTPTPFDVAVGDKAIVLVGCDGLLSTCRDKFNNVLNFGGDPYAPSAQAIISPPEEV
jgi:hypothetical protein